MNVSPDQHDTYIEAVDTSQKSMPAIPAGSAESEKYFLQPTEHVSSIEQNRSMIERGRSKLYDMTLAWRGIYLLGVGFVFGGTWFVYAWCKYGRFPFGYTKSVSSFGFSIEFQPIKPLEWLLVILGLIGLVSFSMMLLGTQDVNKQKKAFPYEHG